MARTLSPYTIFIYNSELKMLKQHFIKINDSRYILFLLFTILINAIIFFMLLNNDKPYSLPELLKHLNLPYNPTQNKCNFDKTYTIITPQLIYIYLLLIIISGALLHNKILSKINSGVTPFSKTILNISIVVLLLTTIPQQISRNKDMIKKMEILQDQNNYRTQKILFAPIYKYIIATKNIIKCCHQSQFISDKLQQEPYLLYQRTLAYYLYPTISFRFKNHAPEDCIIFFYKKNPMNNIPKGYKVVFASDDKIFVLAIKEDKTK